MNPQSPREEIEVRITAMLMGELPPDEAAALQTQIAADAELSALHVRLQRASGLLREATAGHEPHAMLAPVRLSEDRRARLLALFKGEAKPGSVIVKPRHDWKWVVPLGLAASLMALIGGAMYVNGFALRKGSAVLDSLRITDSAVGQFATEGRRAEDHSWAMTNGWGGGAYDDSTRGNDMGANVRLPQDQQKGLVALGSGGVTGLGLSENARPQTVETYKRKIRFGSDSANDAPLRPIAKANLYLPSTVAEPPVTNLGGAAGTSVVAQGVNGGLAIADNRSFTVGGVISNPRPTTAPLPAAALSLDRSTTEEFFSYDAGGVALNSSISTTGSLAKTGSGTLNLAGANTYTGGTTISAGGVLRVGDPVAGVSIAATPAEPAPQSEPVIAPSGPATREIKLRSDTTPDPVDTLRFASTTPIRSPEPNLAGRPRVTATPAPAGKSAPPLADATDSPEKPATAKAAREHFFAEPKQDRESRVTSGTAFRGLGVSVASDGKNGSDDAVLALSKPAAPPVSRTAGRDVAFPMTPTTPTAFSREEPLVLDAKVVEFDGFANTGKAKPVADALPDGAFAGKADPGLGRIAFWNEDETSKVNINPAATPVPVNAPAATSLGLVPRELQDGLEKGNKPRAPADSENAITVVNGSTHFGTISRFISGNGATTLNKAGAGTWDLNGMNTYSGTTTVNAGTFTVNGGTTLNFAAGADGSTTNSLTYSGAGTTGEKAASITTKSGQRANVEVQQKFNFDIDFAPPEIPKLLVAKNAGAVTRPGDGTLDLNGRSTFVVGVSLKGSNGVPGELSEELQLGEAKMLGDIPVIGKLFRGGLATSQPVRNEFQSYPGHSPTNADRLEKKLSEESLALAKNAVKEKEVEKLQEVERDTPKPAPNPLVPQPEVRTGENAFSTFSLNVSDVAFKLAAASLERGAMPDVSTLRTEEFINAFDYRDPEAAPGAPLAFASERARYPFAQNRDVIRFSVKTAAAGRQPGKPLNVVLLLDNSGSMERADRVRIVREGLRTLSAQLTPQDKLSIVTFSRTPRLWADGVAGDKAAEVTARVAEITPEGGTNLGAALDLGYKTALRHYQPGSINHVVMLTDGAANLGDVDPAALKQKVEAHRKQGIALDCFGIGWEGLNDDMLEQLSRNGDGRYGFINTPEEAATNFAGQLAGALRVAASDVKVQVEWNPKRVAAYRQVGYAKHQLTKEQFRDNTVDAAELAAAESGNALYVIEVNPRGEGDLGIVRVRFKVPGTSDYREHEWPVPFTRPAAPLENSSSTLRLAVSAAAFSELLAGSPFATEVTSDRLLQLVNGVPAIYGADARPKKLEWMIRQAKSISGR